MRFNASIKYCIVRAFPVSNTAQLKTVSNRWYDKGQGTFRELNLIISQSKKTISVIDKGPLSFSISRYEYIILRWIIQSVFREGSYLLFWLSQRGIKRSLEWTNQSSSIFIYVCLLVYFTSMFSNPLFFFVFYSSELTYQSIHQIYQQK